MPRLLLLAFFIFTLAAKAEDMAHSTDSLEDIKKAVESGKAVLIDIREKNESEIARVKGVPLIPLSEIKVDAKKAVASLPKDKPIYIHCASGGRALRCAPVLKELGYDVRPVTYNVAAFEKAGFAIEKGK
jgi:phage shock protein E